MEYAGALNVHTLTAKVDDEGNVEGHAEVQLRSPDANIEVEIDCLSVVENNAWLSGTIRTSTDPALVGQPVLFRVQDNDGATDESSGARQSGRQSENHGEGDGEGTGEPDATEGDLTSQVVIGRRAVDGQSAPTLGLITSGSVKVR